MGKKHFPEDKSGRRGAGNDAGRPGSSAGRSSGGTSRPSGERGGFEPRGTGSRPAGRGEGYSPARPSFGQGGGKFGSRPGDGSSGKFGGDRPSFGSGERPERRSYEGGDRRPNSGGERSTGGERGNFSGSRDGDRLNRGSYGDKRSFGNDRGSFGGKRNAGNDRGSFGEKRSFGGDRPARFERPDERSERPRRFEPGSERGERAPREERAERPAYPPKPIWQGQPVRYEGKPTVPRGGQGERNRKFIKQDPTAESTARPAYTGRDERRSFEEGGAEKTAGYGATPRSRPGDDRERRPEGNRPYGGSDAARPPRREGEERSERRSFGGPDRDRREGSYGAPRKSDNDRGERREGGSADRPRSYGERPANTGGSFRERREAMRAQTSGPRSSTGYGSRTEQPSQAPDYKNLKHYENDKTRGNKRRRDEEDFGTEELRLNRYIANAGICSRREADALIAAGEIRVNGEVVTEMGYKVQPTDTVQYGKTNLNREKLVYVLLNKPKDFITTTDDPEGRKTVMDLIANASKERIFPVGRLDRNTTGLLLFTNDGEVAQKLSHPSHKNKKIYQAELDKPLTPEHLAEITAGVELEDGKAEIDDVAVVAGNPHFVGIELHIGRNRVVRRIFEHLGYDVIALDRVQYAGLTKKELPRGKWRFLSEQEVIRLKYFMA
ncbi:MAG: pseudouridine synthase [Janthinobacterium lividum]